MNKITLILVSGLFALSATTALAMDGQADRFNETKSYPDKTLVVAADINSSAQ
ncbi:hypothetical protein [Marinobacter sp.]|uniref:hypothetical protein n=1 Tax=Marinobacter sp. TaxID=50741 RepID=UPI00356903BB